MPTAARSRDPRLHIAAALVIAALVALYAFAAAAARPSPETNPTRATVETLGGIEGVDGWCDGTITPFQFENLLASKPARISAAVMADVRFATLTYVPNLQGGNDARACVIVGGLTGKVAGDTGCSGIGSDDTGAVMFGGTMPLAIARDPATGTLPPILWTSEAEDAVLCITIGF